MSIKHIVCASHCSHFSLSLHVYVYIYVYVYVFMCTCVCVYVYVYAYIIPATWKPEARELQVPGLSGVLSKSKSHPDT